jgi:flagellar motor switch/type III secretory pathway protein FliN
MLPEACPRRRERSDFSHLAALEKISVDITVVFGTTTMPIH